MPKIPNIPKIIGYDVNKLPDVFKTALNTYLHNGAVKVSRLLPRLQIGEK
jgi:hypothetical protein